VVPKKLEPRVFTVPGTGKAKKTLLADPSVDPAVGAMLASLAPLIAYLSILGSRKDDQGRKCHPREILGRLPRWPWALVQWEKRYNENTIPNKPIKKTNKSRWANTLRHLKASDCPLLEQTRKDAIEQYKMALVVEDELRKFSTPQQLTKLVYRRLGVPANLSRAWATAVNPLVNYLSPFYPMARQKGSKKRPYAREGAVSNATCKTVAKILHLAYPRYWPTIDARRVQKLYLLD